MISNYDYEMARYFGIISPPKHEGPLKPDEGRVLTRQEVLARFSAAYQGNKPLDTELPVCEVDCQICEYPRLRSVVDKLKGYWFRLGFWWKQHSPISTWKYDGVRYFRIGSRMSNWSLTFSHELMMLQHKLQIVRQWKTAGARKKEQERIAKYEKYNTETHL